MEKCGETQPRTNLFTKLNDVIEQSHKKATAERGNADLIKQGWARILISAIATYGSLLKDVEIDQLKQEVNEIKKQLETRGKTWQ